MPVSNNSSYYSNNQPVDKIYRGNMLLYQLVKFWSIGIQTTTANEVFGITLFNGGSPPTIWNITIDWGDGTVQDFIGTHSNNNLLKTNTYSTPGTYTIKLSGNISYSSLDLPPNIRFYGTRSPETRVISTSIVPKIAVHTFNSTFFQCSNLSSIPVGIFDKNTSATSSLRFRATFQGCTSLTTVPSTLFEKNVNANTFVDCFQGVTLTTESYSNLLINMASNAASRLNNVLFGGGNSKYNAAGQTARNILIAKGWSFSDGGLE